MSDIREVVIGLKSHSNGGFSHTNKKAKYGGFLAYLETWFNEDVLANILSFDKLDKLFPITYDHENKHFIVHTKGLDTNEGKVVFKHSPEGFPYIDLREQEQGWIMINTIRGNIEGFSPAQVKAAEEAYKAQALMGLPGDRDMQALVRSSSLLNNHVTPAAVSHSQAIYDHSLSLF